MTILTYAAVVFSVVLVGLFTFAILGANGEDESNAE